MRRKISALCILALLASGSGFAADSPSKRLEKYGDELVKAWTDFPSDKQQPVRQMYIQDITKAYQADLKNTVVDSDMTMARAVDKYVDHIVKSRALFKNYEKW